MNSRALLVILAAGIILGTAPLFPADNPPSQLTFEIVPTGPGEQGEAKVSNESQVPNVIAVQGTTVTMRINCNGVKCQNVSALFVGQQINLTTTDTSANAQLTLKTAADNPLILLFNNRQILQRKIEQAGVSSSTSGAATLDANQLAFLLQNPCDHLQPGSPSPHAEYHAKENQASVLIGVNGRV